MTSPTTTVLRTLDLEVGYRHRRRTRVVLGHLDLEADAGQFVCVLGPNGSGKSTLLRTVSGAQSPLRGRVSLLGHDAERMSPAERALILATVLTDRPDVGLLTVDALVALGRHPHTGWSGRLTAHDVDVVDRAVDAVGARHLRGRMFGELSDGERQRVYIARALAQEPVLLLADEPTAFLDVDGRAEIMALLAELAHDRGIAVVTTTHELELALELADRVWLLDGDGGLMSGSPDTMVTDGSVTRVFTRAGAFLARREPTGRGIPPQPVVTPDS